MMKLISKYITKQIFFGFFLVSVGMMALVWLVQSLKMIDLFVTKGLPLNLFLKMTFLALPNFLSVISPLAFFAVALFVLNRMSFDRELTVMKSVGLSPWTIAKPILFLACLLVGLEYVLTIKVIPESITKFRELQWQVKGDLTHLLLQEGEFNFISKGYTIYVREREKDGTLLGIMIYDQSDPSSPKTIFAEKGAFIQEDGKAELIMLNGSRQEVSKADHKYSFLYFDRSGMDFSDILSSSRRRHQKDTEMSLKTLLGTKKGSVPDDDYRMYKVEALKRVTQPFYSLVFVLVAMTFLLLGRFGRGGQTKQAVAAVLAVLLIQSGALGFENLSNKNLGYIGLMVLNIVIPMIICLFLLKKGQMLDEYKWKNPFKKKELLFLFFFLTAFETSAQVADLEKKKQLPVEFESDEVVYDKETGEVIAVGNVKVEQDGSVLKADKMMYNQAGQKLRATGNLSLKQPDGTEITAKEGNFRSDFLVGSLDDIAVIFPDGTQIWADLAERRDEGNITFVEEGVFTPCDFCVASSPLWALRAEELEHNDAELEFTQKNSFLEIKGYPLLYWPYLKYPDFRVKRKTGFLAPELKKTQEMGTAVGVPFFWALGDNQDLEITPYFSAGHIPFVFNRYRGIFKKAFSQMDMSVTRDENDKNLGHIKGFVNYDINDKWRFESNIYLTSDDTYFRRYKIKGTDDSASWLQNDFAFERFDSSSYFALKGLGFENLRADVKDSSMPYVAPLVSYTLKSQPIYRGGYFTTHIHSATITRHNHEDARSLSLDETFTMPYIGKYGELITLESSLRMDGYSVDTKDFKGYVGRVYPNASVEFKYPLISKGKNLSQVIEPVIKMVWAPSSSGKDKIPNNDSLDTEFDDSNLFSNSRFTGYDRVEYGTHIAYGIKWASYARYNTALSAFIGQSYQLSEAEVFPETSGLRPDFSDYVGHLMLSSNYFSARYRFRLDYKSFQPRSSELSVNAGTNPLRVGLNYMFLKRSDSTYSNFPDREEITYYVSSKLLKNWSIQGFYQYGLGENKGPIKAGGTLTYEDECTQVAFDVEKSYTEDRDYKGDLTFLLRLNLKMLGGV